MNLLKFDFIDSTNTYGVKNFDDLKDKTIITANEQTAGKGRFERVWVSKNCENIYISFVLKPQNKNHLSNLTQYLSTAAAKVIETYGITPEIKWPNDVLVNGKKICGILCEGVLEKNKFKGVVLGIGVNLNYDEQTLKNIERPATSLNLETKKPIDKEIFLNLLINEFFKNYEKAAANGFESFKDEYLKFVKFLGRKIFIQERDGAQKILYTAKSLDEKGNLIVIDSKNNEKIILSGDLIY